MARVLLLLCALPLAAGAEGFGAELGVGPGYGAAASVDAIVPALSLRAEYGAPYFSAGLRGLFFLGPEASYAGGGSRVDPSGFQAWAALAEISAHTGSTISFGARLAGGVGKVIGLNCDCEEVAPLHGHVAPAFLASLFGSVRLADHSRAILELAAARFADLERGEAPFSQPASGVEAWTFAILVALQWAQR
jgi:hypothetical protein